MLVPLEKPDFSVRFEYPAEDLIEHNLKNIKMIYDKLREFQEKEKKCIDLMQINQNPTMLTAKTAGMKDVYKKLVALGKKLDEAEKSAEHGQRIT